MSRICFITGTDTGVGKTVLTSLLARYLCQRGVAVAALKPICSGGRADARALRTAVEGALALDEINPWHFRAPLAPLLAARLERKRVALDEVLAHVRKIQMEKPLVPRVPTRSYTGPDNQTRRRSNVVLIEGAGGLLSPLGEDFTARDLIVRLNAALIIVGPNKLGVVNHLLLTLEALPRPAARQASIVLMPPGQENAASRTNAKLLAERIDPERVLVFPCLPKNTPLLTALEKPFVRRMLEKLALRLNP